MRVASIDIGTNTLLLLIADIDERGIRPLHHEQRFPRLGRDVDRHGLIHVAAFDRIGWVLNEYKNLSTQYAAGKIVACATSAVRDASNREEFLAFIRSTTGIGVETLTGDEEARWSYRGALTAFGPLSPPAAVIDIGGGSTEVSYPPFGEESRGENPLRRFSFQLGSVRLTERFFKHDPPKSEEVSAAREFLKGAWSPIGEALGELYTLVGVAGTVTTLAALDQGLPDFDAAKIGGYRISREHVEKWFSILSGLSAEQIEALSGAAAGRADILTAGVLILAEFMGRFQFREVLTSERGLRYGLVVREWEKAGSSRSF